jgi:hypothetical protein
MSENMMPSSSRSMHSPDMSDNIMPSDSIIGLSAKIKTQYLIRDTNYDQVRPFY